MNDIPEGYYRHENGMLKQIEASPPTQSVGITDATIEKLGQMQKDDLITLIKLVSGAIWGYALATKDEKREAMRLRVYNIAMTSSDNETVLKACNQWLDREEGKPQQKQVIDLNETKEVTVNINDPAALMELAKRVGFVLTRASDQHKMLTIEGENK